MMVKCKECKTKVSSKAKLCPHCGVKNPGVNYVQGTIGLIFIIGAIYFYNSSDSAAPTTTPSVTEQTQPTTAKKEPSAPQWTQGGTLVDKGALDWQQASNANKLASCATIISRMVERGILTDKIHNQLTSWDALKIVSVQMQKNLDTAFAPESNKDLNVKLFTSQKVLDTAIMLAITDGWIENKKS
ncbi:MAG: hypothetical protein HWE39_12715 [Oceanospirillaceae bacterium]|nr:hypothetical protein [Oceanospirillaceae bacterium]